MRKSASVDQRKGVYVVASQSKTTAGFWIANGWFDVLPVDAATRGKLGQLVRASLDHTTHGAPVPPRGAPSALAPVYAAVGVKNYGQYVKGLRSVDVSSDEEDGEERIGLTPMHNGGTSEGLSFLTDLVETEVYDSPGQLGEAVLRAIARAT
jgi:hypothetical protein